MDTVKVVTGASEISTVRGPIVVSTYSIVRIFPGTALKDFTLGNTNAVIACPGPITDVTVA
jgi:hypothetical protein